jgi:hypothetical protein
MTNRTEGGGRLLTRRRVVGLAVLLVVLGVLVTPVQWYAASVAVERERRRWRQRRRHGARSAAASVEALR